MVVCSAGQFYECMNMASLYKLPCIFVVENNKWAIGMDHHRATARTEGDNLPFIYKKGPAFGMPGVLVDGMDVRKVMPLIVLVVGVRTGDPCMQLPMPLHAGPTLAGTVDCPGRGRLARIE